MPILTREERQRRLDAWREYAAAGLSKASCARALGMKASAFVGWLADQEAEESQPAPLPVAPPPPPAQPAPEPTPQERHGQAFWRRRSAELQRELDAVTHMAEELAGIRGITVDPPAWQHAPSEGGGRSIAILHTSDVHMGEVIDPAEIEGINSYDVQIARERMRRLFSAACELGPRWMHGDTCDGLLLTMAGDLISGDIHEELRITNALTAHEQVQAVVEVYEAGLRMLLDVFPAVHVVVVPGNHGRTTPKPTAKLAARLSYDTLAGAMLRDRMRSEARITWQIAEGADARVPIYGRTILTTHGDRMGTGGGMGFAGPVLPIVRGGHKVQLQAARMKLGCDLILSGHYHTAANPPNILANGSVPGYSEFGNGIRAAVEPPSQWLARFSLRWGLCERLPVRLDDPTRPRVKAATCAA